jgi:hypothetical protein
MPHTHIHTSGVQGEIGEITCEVTSAKGTHTFPPLYQIHSPVEGVPSHLLQLVRVSCLRFRSPVCTAGWSRSDVERGRRIVEGHACAVSQERSGPSLSLHTGIFSPLAISRAEIQTLLGSTLSMAIDAHAAASQHELVHAEIVAVFLKSSSTLCVCVCVAPSGGDVATNGDRAQSRAAQSERSRRR